MSGLIQMKDHGLWVNGLKCKRQKMKHWTLYGRIVLVTLFLTACADETQVNEFNTVETIEKTEFDTPMKRSERQIENLNIVNSIQNPTGYLNSRIEARGSSKQSVQESNKQTEAQDKAIEAFMK